MNVATNFLSSINPFQPATVSNRSVLPSVIGQNLEASKNLYGLSDLDRRAIAMNMQREGLLVDQFGNVINGTAPSVAQNQLEQGLNAISAEQRSLGSGATGNNIGLATMNAARNISAEQIAANQQAALIRAKEAADARIAQAALLGQIGNQGQASYNTNVVAGTGLLGNAITGAGVQEKAEADRITANKNALASGVNGLGSVGQQIMNFLPKGTKGNGLQGILPSDGSADGGNLTSSNFGNASVEGATAGQSGETTGEPDDNVSDGGGGDF